ncbi:MAG: hypothetical protein KatS3mg103_0258 [Phycisphaerales bacterium]|nr:MAG: hypothetical protein KatS3mg103_0258 [Phycisphaerales bacterium]
MSDIGRIKSGLTSADLEPRPVGRKSGPAGISQPGREAQAPRREADRVELTDAARNARQAGQIRAELVIRVREEIVRGVYETPREDRRRGRCHAWSGRPGRPGRSHRHQRLRRWIAGSCCLVTQCVAMQPVPPDRLSFAATLGG